MNILTHLKQSNFNELCQDFENRKPKGAEISIEPLFSIAWIGEHSSSNDLLTKWLIEENIPYINDLGVVWFLYKGGWTRSKVKYKQKLGIAYFSRCIFKTEGSPYTIETITAINPVRANNERVTQEDVDIANRFVEIIEKSRTDYEIQPGDIVEFTNKYGDYYRNAHIEQVGVGQEGKCHIYAQAHTPFIWLTENKDNISCWSGGGGQGEIPKNLKLIGKRKKYFSIFGIWGTLGYHSAMMFEAFVNVWEYIEPEPFIDGYTTQYYDRRYISYVVDEFGKPKDGSPYCCFGIGNEFRTKVEYETWRATYRGIEFDGHSDNQSVVWTYRRIEKLISKEEFDALDWPIDTRSCNLSIIPVKVMYDDELHCVHEYRYTNKVEEDYYPVPYMLAIKERRF